MRTERLTRVAAALIAAASLVACGGGSAGGRTSSAQSPNPTRAPSPAAAHTASFGGPSGDPVHGTVTVTPVAGGYSVHVQASGLVPGHAYALHVHGGRCVGQRTVTSTFQLPAMAADAKGNGSVTATLVNVPPLGSTFVLHVHGGTTPGTADYRRVECTPLPA